MNHFAQRCLERGITETDPELLQREIGLAVRGELEPGRELVERVMSTPTGGSEIFRFRVSEGIFYAVVGPEGVAKTVLTQAMMKKKKWARKKAKSGIKRG